MTKAQVRDLPSQPSSFKKERKIKMYKVQDIPDQPFLVVDGGYINSLKPLITLKNEHGGLSHIVKDDNHYVLYNYGGGSFNKTYYWYPEAIVAVRQLSINVFVY